MKSRAGLSRLRAFEVTEKQRKVADIETMVAEFRRMAGELDVQIEAEEARSGITDPAHFSYPPFAKAARQRRDNLQQSVDDLDAKLAAARDELTAAEAELDKIETFGERGSDTGTRRSLTSGPRNSDTPRATARPS